MVEELTRIKITRELNDQFRCDMPHGTVRIKGGAKQLSNDQLVGITQLIQSFDDFRPDSDVSDLHDNGAVDFEGVKVVWQIETDCKALAHEPPETGDSAVRPRFLIIMLPEDM